MSGTCSSCRLWDRPADAILTPSQAHCRFAPVAAPLLVPVGNRLTGEQGMAIQIVTCWSQTKPEDWCSHHTPTISLN